MKLQALRSITRTEAVALLTAARTEGDIDRKTIEARIDACIAAGAPVSEGGKLDFLKLTAWLLKAAR